VPIANLPITPPTTTLEQIAHAVRVTGCAWNGGAGGNFIIMGTAVQVRRFADKLLERAMTALAQAQHMPQMLKAKDEHIAELEQEIRISEKIIEERNRLLNDCPPCPVHGEGCVPHAREWLQELKNKPADATWVAMFARRCEVEQLMFDAARGKRPMPTQQELREWALKLGTPHVKEPANEPQS
jgi:hypothetical protein